MKTRNIRSLICGIICLSFSAFFFFGAAFVSGDLKNRTPFAIELYSPQGLEVSMAQASPLTELGGFAAASPGEKVQAAAEAEGRSVLAYCQMTTANYGAYANLQFSEGQYFSDDASAEHAAVIPESLSKELFAGRSGKKTLYINGTEFAVCGVYKDDGILVQLGSAKLPVIYRNGSENSDAPAEHLLIGADAAKTAKQQQQEKAVTMRAPLEGEINDLGRLHQLGDSILLLGFFFAGLWFILRLCIFSYRKLIAAYECKEHTSQRGFQAFLGAGALALALFGFALLLQLVRIPAVYLPENNIFDFPYYGRQILRGIQQMNTDCRIKDFSRICAFYLCAETVSLILGVPLFWAGCQSLRWGFLDK